MLQIGLAKEQQVRSKDCLKCLVISAPLVAPDSLRKDDVIDFAETAEANIFRTLLAKLRCYVPPKLQPDLS